MIELTQNLCLGMTPRVKTCPYCEGDLYFVATEPAMCLYCYQELPSAGSLMDLQDARLDFYIGSYEECFV